MFRRSDNDSDTKVGYTRSGRLFRENPLTNLFNKSYKPLPQDEGFYSGEEAKNLDEEYSEFAKEEEERTKQPH